MKKKKKQLIDSIAQPYRSTATPECEFFGSCGGCLFQDISYENQLLLKKDYLNGVFKDVLEIDKVHSSIKYGYRNRMDYVTAFGKRGLRKRGFFKEVIDITKCPLLQNESSTVWQEVRQLTENLNDYNFVVHKGILRYIVLRQSYFKKETMCNFVLNEYNDECIQALEKINADSKSIIIHSGLADLSFGEVERNIKNGFITEEFDGIKFRIYPNSFFQSNSECALNVYRKIADASFGNLLDLYCGVGSISLFAAQKAEQVTGVEIVQEAVNAANENKELNNINNTEFICADALDYMKTKRNQFDCVVLDPPRSGVHPKVYKYLSELNPKRIIYMSCNPSAFKEEIQYLPDYKISSFEAFDMFPQTPHIETLAVLDKK